MKFILDYVPFPYRTAIQLGVRGPEDDHTDGRNSTHFTKSRPFFDSNARMLKTALWFKEP